MEVVVTTGTIRRAKLQSNCHHQQTNMQFFTGRMPFLSPNQQCQSTGNFCLYTVKHKSFVTGNFHNFVYFGAFYDSKLLCYLTSQPILTVEHSIMQYCIKTAQCI